MTDLIPAPDDLPDLESVTLPTRACLLSVRDTLVPARAEALEDAVREARALSRRSRPRDDQSFAALACAWEAVSCMELAANTAAPWLDPQIPDAPAPYIEMTRYDPGRTTRFFESSHKWTNERFEILSAHRFRHGGDDDDPTLLETFVAEGMVDERLRAAFTEAQAATASFLRRRFELLAAHWQRLSRFAQAFEHGGLLVPADVGEVVDEHGRVVESSLMVYETRRARSQGELAPTVDGVIDTAELVGGIAVDLAHHVADARLLFVEALELVDGKLFLNALQDPFPFWCERGDLTPGTLELLEAGVRLTWKVDDDVGG